MQFIKARYRNRTNRKLRDTQKQYTFICPIEGVKAGDHVLVEHYPEGKVTRFTVAYVDEVYEMSIKELMKTKDRPRFFAIAKIDIKDMDKRIDQVKKMKYTLFSIYDGTHKKNGRKTKFPKAVKDNNRKADVEMTHKKKELTIH